MSALQSQESAKPSVPLPALRNLPPEAVSRAVPKSTPAPVVKTAGSQSQESARTAIGEVVSIGADTTTRIATKAKELASARLAKAEQEAAEALADRMVSHVDGQIQELGDFFGLNLRSVMAEVQADWVTVETPAISAGSALP